MIRRPPRSTPLYSSAASDVYKRQLRDPFEGFPSNPVASVTGDGVANPPAANVTPQPEVTSGPAAYGQPLPLYSSFASLFPARFFGSTGDMPPSLLVHSLVQTVVWTTTMLRGMLRGTPLPPNLTPVDESGRLAIMPTPFWPGGNHSLSSSLEAVSYTHLTLPTNREV